jgi:hypothetical protein
MTAQKKRAFASTRQGGVIMKYVLISAALLLGVSGAQPALAQKPSDLVAQAVKAQGGADALRALKGVTIKGEAKFWEPGQSFIAGGEPRFLGDATFTTTWDLSKGMARTEWDRDQKYPAPAKMKYTETALPTFGFVTDDKGATAMSSIRIAAHLRELNRASPAILLKAMGSRVLFVERKARLGKQTLPAMSFMDGGAHFTILFDRASHLPAAIRTRDDDNIDGDSNYDLVLSDWKAVGGVQMAQTLSYQLNGVEVAHIVYKDVAANPSIAADAFNAPDAVKAAAKAPATGSTVPYQWVIRRLFLTRFLDSDGIIVPPGKSLSLVELGPNVSQALGGTANNLIVAMSDGLAIFDAPYGELQSKWVIDAAKKKYPGKPIKYLILTHHHMDHTGGMRTYVAEGATVIVPQGDKAYFQEDSRNPHTVVPDEQQKKHNKTAKVIEVADQMSLKDKAGNEIRLYNIANPHVQGMIMGHVVKDNVVWVTDIWSPGRDKTKSPGTVAVSDAVKKYGITGATFAGGHGSNDKQSTLDEIVAQK